MKPPRNRNGQVPPLALILLIGLLALPFAYFFLPDARVWADPNFSPPRYELRWGVPEGDPAAPATENMKIDEAGRTSVYDAPQILPVEEWGSGVVGFIPDAQVTADVARFMKALPREKLSRSQAEGDRVTTCTMEGEAQYAGRIVLHNGCLRLQQEGKSQPGPIVLGFFAVFRDAENYLSVGAMGGKPEAALRVGEPNAQLLGVGCSRDKPVKAPEKLARICGADTLIRIGKIRRETICSEERIAALEKQAREYRIANDRLRAESAACVANNAGNGRSASCPPSAAPMPSPMLQNCRMPADVQRRIERAMRPPA